VFGRLTEFSNLEFPATGFYHIGVLLVLISVYKIHASLRHTKTNTYILKIHDPLYFYFQYNT
jgi:hypothetical protein